MHVAAGSVDHESVANDMRKLKGFIEFYLHHRRDRNNVSSDSEENLCASEGAKDGAGSQGN